MCGNCNTSSDLDVSAMLALYHGASSGGHRHFAPIDIQNAHRDNRADTTSAHNYLAASSLIISRWLMEGF
jgi:hypothetical protein